MDWSGKPGVVTPEISLSKGLGKQAGTQFILGGVWWGDGDQVRFLGRLGTMLQPHLGDPKAQSMS